MQRNRSVSIGTRVWKVAADDAMPWINTMTGPSPTSCAT
jgi:hypothetical protein